MISPSWRQEMKLLILILLTSLSAFASFDHEHKSLTTILKTYTKKDGLQTLVNYKSIKGHHAELTTYLNQLQSLKRKEFKTFTKDQKLAFWINAYNAYKLEVIVKNYPLKSIKDLGGAFGGFFGTSPWDKKFIPMFGKTITLNDIEHKIIRKKFKEPRIHFAVNCASIGCPSILSEAFVAAKLDAQLNIAAANFLDNKDKNFVKGNTLKLSKIFKWYGDDFEDKYGSFKKFILKHYSLSGDFSVDYLDYDWNLNEYQDK